MGHVSHDDPHPTRLLMELRVTMFDEPVLREKGEPVTAFDDGLKAFAEDMLETMYAHNGIGLAAQQVGRNIQLCVIDVDLSDDGPPAFRYRLDGRTPPLDVIMPMALVNPGLTFPDSREMPYEEGCLSFPDIRGEVLRPDVVVCKFQDLDGAWHTVEADGLFGRAIQHEVDHLNGVLFIDRMAPATLKQIERKVKKLKRQTRDYLKSLR